MNLTDIPVQRLDERELNELFRIEPHNPADQNLAEVTQRLLEIYMASQPHEYFYDFILRNIDKDPLFVGPEPEPAESQHFM